MQTVAATAGRFAEIFPPTASQMYDTRLQESNRSRALPRWFPVQRDARLYVSGARCTWGGGVPTRPRPLLALAIYPTGYRTIAYRKIIKNRAARNRLVRKLSEHVCVTVDRRPRMRPQMFQTLSLSLSLLFRGLIHRLHGSHNLIAMT